MWVYVLFIGDPQTPNVLDDQTWPAKAEEVCTHVAADVAALPPARSFVDVQPFEEALRRRADVADQATSLLDGQLTSRCGRCRRRAASTTTSSSPPGSPTGTPICRTGTTARTGGPAGTARFAETEADTGGPISNRMAALAKENRMPSCVVPGDLG